jgi:RND family efflux transporter MFP subunit
METGYRVAQEQLKAAQQSLEQSVSGRKEDIEAQEVAIRGLEDQVREAKILLDDSTLRAPFDGVIAQRLVEEKQNVSPQQPIVRFQNTGEVDIAVDVPESIMGSGLTADRIVEIIAEFTAVPGQRFPVKVKEVAQVADPVTQTFRIRAGMKAPPEANVLPGMTAMVTLTYRRAEKLDNQIRVPISAVYKESSGQQVAWVLEDDQVVKRRPVKIGEAAGGQLEVVNGLESGDRIAVAGVSFLRDGMRVHDLGNALGDDRP